MPLNKAIESGVKLILVYLLLVKRCASPVKTTSRFRFCYRAMSSSLHDMDNGEPDAA